MAQLTSVLTQGQRDSLEIVDFIFHVIQKDREDDEGVVYLDEVTLQAKQRNFFLAQLKDIAEGTQYVFLPDAVHLKEKCEQLVSDRSGFAPYSRQITSDFASRHKGSMSPGVFVIAIAKYLASANNWKSLVFLVKMDKRESFSYQWTEVEGKKVAVIDEIQNALTENKASIQKSALIDVQGVFSWNVLAFDRSKKPLLGDYFKGFLGVTERLEPSELTRLAHGVVKKWAREIPQEQLPEGEDVNTYAGRSLNYLTDSDVFDTDAFLATVVRDQDPQRKAEFVRALRSKLEEAGVAGQSFTPRPGSLTKKMKKNIYWTDEGVKIEYEGTNESAGIRITNRDGGGKIITIETEKLSTER